MMGSGDDVGVIPLMNKDIFSRVHEMTNDATKFLITVSFLEIYNEVIKDLLNPSDKFLKIREHPDMGIYVEHLAELIVREPSDVSSLIEQGNKVRQVAATQMNERSSRSHSCFTIKIGMKVSETIGDVEREVSTNSKINLVDLAGSERAAKTGATGDRLKEGAAINKSLSALGNVINMLADRSKKGHVPYRDSKLTRLLQESLGGNSLTVMVAAISPADYNYDETVGTLQYADRAKSIKNATKKNEDVNDTIIRELREEIERLREMVQSGGPTSTIATSSEDMSKMEEMIANLERAKHQSWEEKERLAKLYEQERQKSLANETNVLQFMQTVKEEKVEAIKRVRYLQQQKAKLSKKFREKKETYGFNKTKLQKDMLKYQDLLQRVETMDEDAVVEREGDLQTLLEEIETTRESLVTDRDLLTKIKDKQSEIDEKLVEERAEMAAKSAVLQEDENLRKAIQDDERSKMEKLKQEYLHSALEDERQRLKAEIEFEKERLEEKYNQSSNEKEESLKQAVYLHEQNATKLKQKLVMVQDIRTGHLKTFERIVDEITSAFEDERREMEKKYHTAVELLQQAKGDIAYLSMQNKKLEKQVALATAYEATSS